MIELIRPVLDHPIVNTICIIFTSYFWYKLGKGRGFDKGLDYIKGIGIHKSAEGHEHFCNVTLSDVVCLERNGELWVKEYTGLDQPAGRTYLVFHCPWCGYQTEKSKLRESIEPKGIR